MALTPTSLLTTSDLRKSRVWIDCFDQRVPFQWRRTPCPTAHVLVGEGASTASSSLPGTGTIDQRMPSQCSRSERNRRLVLVEQPTAHASAADTPTTP